MIAVLYGELVELGIQRMPWARLFGRVGLWDRGQMLVDVPATCGVLVV